MSFYSAGGDSYKVPFSMHAENRNKFLDKLQAAKIEKASFVLLQGGAAKMRNDTDHEVLFRQESFFHYLFGVKEPDWYGVLDVERRRTTLFVPRLPDAYGVWMGKILTPAEWRAHYEVDECLFVDELAAFLDGAKVGALHVLSGVNNDSGERFTPATFVGIDRFKVERDVVFPHLVECRLIKSAKEIDLMRHVCKVSSDAHVEVMRRIRPGMSEFQVEALFRYYCHHVAGFRNCSYTCICAAGNNGATLHYGHAGAPNDKRIGEHDMLLHDMGGEYHCYGADITRSFPVSGKFDARQRIVYGAVLAAQDAVLAAMRPGVAWLDMHLLAERALLGSLLRAGLLRGSVDDMMSQRLGAVFMPHGLGHLLGIDTHDVGGFEAGAVRSSLPGLKSLRCMRALQPGMIITVEPGCYFIDMLLDAALANVAQAPFLVVAEIDRFRGIGGVRIEDDVVITPTGIENLTTAPRSIDAIEALMAHKLPVPFETNQAGAHHHHHVHEVHHHHHHHEPKK